MGANERLGMRSLVRTLADGLCEMVAAQGRTPAGVYAGMGEGLLRLLVVRARVT